MTDNRFTGQKEDGTGLVYMNARYYDPVLGQFISPDTIVPDATNVFDYNRYMYVRGNPLRYSDPSGHFSQSEIESYLQSTYGEQWRAYLYAWKSDNVFWEMLLAAQIGDELWAPTSPSLGHGTFIASTSASFDFHSWQGNSLYEFQGYGPYRLTTVHGDERLHVEKTFTYGLLGTLGNYFGITNSPSWQQPLYRYAEGQAPRYSGYDRLVSYEYDSSGFHAFAGDGMPYLPGAFGAMFGATAVIVLCPACDVAAISAAAAAAWATAETGTFLNNAVSANHVLTVDLVDRRTWIVQSPLPCLHEACFAPGAFVPPDESQGLHK